MNRNFLKLAVGFLAMVGQACENSKPQPAPLRPVRYMPLGEAAGKSKHIFSGVLRSANEVLMSFKIPGTIDKLEVKVGDRVEAEQVIAVLDSQSIELELGEGKAALSQAFAEAKNRKSDYDRVRQLYASGNSSKRDLDRARTAHNSAQAGLRLRQKTVERLELKVSYATLKAPNSGNVAAVLKEKGENVGAGNPVLRLDSGALEMEVQVPASIISQIKVGDKSEVQVEADRSVRTQATVIQVAQSTAPGLTTFPVILEIASGNLGLKPGMSGEAEFAKTGLSNQGDTWRVPAHSVASDGKGKFVFLVKPVPEQSGGLSEKSESAENSEPGDSPVFKGQTSSISSKGTRTGLIEKRYVEVGPLLGEWILVKSGLGAGDLVVTAGVSKIRPNQKVRISKKWEVGR